MDKALLDAFAARAAQKAEARLEIKTFHIGELALECRRLSQEDTLRFYEAFSEAEKPSELLDICTSVIYESCPALQDPELHSMLGVIDPLDTVRRLLDVREIDMLGGEVGRWQGLAAPTAEEMAKN